MRTNTSQSEHIKVKLKDIVPQTENIKLYA